MEKDLLDNDLSGGPGSWVVVPPEEFQQAGVVGPVHVVLHLYTLGVVSKASAQLHRYKSF